jgi:SAM-dependent methyltransferase
VNGSLAKSYCSPEAAEAYGARHRDRWIRRWISRREASIVAGLLKGLPAGALLLDVPCGTGRHTASFRDAGWNAFGIDVSIDMIQHGISGSYLNRGGAAVASVFELPFADGSVEGCACLRFFHHLPEEETQQNLLTELRRVVRGPIVLSLWTCFNFQWGRRAVKRCFGRRPSARYALNLGTFQKRLARSGFAVKKRRYLFRYISETVYLLIQPSAVP